MEAIALETMALETIANRVVAFLDQPDELGFALRHKDGRLAVMVKEDATLVCQTWNEAETFRKEVIGQRKGHARQWRVVPITSRRLAKRPLLAFRFGTGEGLSSYFVVEPAAIKTT